MERKTKILFLAANPHDTTRLSIDEELRQILHHMRSAEFGNRFDVQAELALRPEELPAALMRHKPDIMHFSGHGTSDGALCLVHDATHQTQPASPEQILGLFRPLSRDLRCVVLSACYSEAQAKAIVQCVPCVIGMSRSIKDDAAIVFAAGFYEALAFGESVQTAFELGCARMGLLPPGRPPQRSVLFDEESAVSHVHSEKEVPQLLTQEGVDPAKVILLKRDSSEESHRVQKKQKVGNITISGSASNLDVTQNDTHRSGKAHSVKKKMEVGDISISGRGNAASISQNDTYGNAPRKPRRTD